MGPIILVMPYIGKNLSVNSYRLSGKKGQQYLIKSSVKGWMVELAKKAEELKYLNLSPPLVITVSSKFLDRLNSVDPDNLSKVICDALERGLGMNDKDFRYRVGTVAYGYTDPILEIEVSKEV